MKMNKIITNLAMPLAVCLSGLSMLNSCSSEDTPGSGNNGEDFSAGKGAYFLAVKASSGTEYIMQAQSLEEKDLNINENVMELPQQDYTWIFKDNLAIGMTYQQQFAGIGYGLTLKADSTLNKLGEFKIEDRFTNYGFFGNQLVTSVAGQVSTDGKRNDGATFNFFNINSDNIGLGNRKTLWTRDIAGGIVDGDTLQATFSSIVDRGNGEFLTSMIKSTFHQTSGANGGNGSSIGDVLWPDKVWVVSMDKDLNIKHTFESDKLSYSGGRFRAQMLPQILKTENGTVYVFSNSFVRFEDKSVQVTPTTNAHPAGALRIKSGANEFDPTYSFNIEEPAGGYPFRRVWYMTGDKFLLEMYNVTSNDKSGINVNTPGHWFAIVDMEKKSFTKVTGVPAKNMISSGNETGGVPLFYNNKVYMPITEIGKDAAIYMINPETGVATKGITLKGVKEIRTIGHLNVK